MDPVITPAELAPSTANPTPPTLVPATNVLIVPNVNVGPVADSITPSVCPAKTVFPSGSTAIELTWVAGAGSDVVSGVTEVPETRNRFPLLVPTKSVPFDAMASAVG